MTKISDIYNALTSVLEANLSGYTRIPNGYVINENPEILLRRGYGLAVGPGFDTNREVCKIYWRRTFTIILTQQMMALPNNVESREIIERELLDKHDVIRKALYNTSLNGTVFNTAVVSDAGIGFIDVGTQKFLGLEMAVELEYQENVNS